VRGSEAMKRPPSMKRALKILGGVVGFFLPSQPSSSTFTLVCGHLRSGTCEAETRLDLAKLRELGDRCLESGRAKIRVEEVGGGMIPQALACPGTSWSKVGLACSPTSSWFPDQTIVVDAAMSKAQAEDLDMVEGYDDAAWAR